MTEPKTIAELIGLGPEGTLRPEDLEVPEGLGTVILRCFCCESRKPEGMGVTVNAHDWSELPDIKVTTTPPAHDDGLEFAKAIEAAHKAVHKAVMASAVRLARVRLPRAPLRGASVTGPVMLDDKAEWGAQTSSEDDD